MYKVQFDLVFEGSNKWQYPPHTHFPEHETRSQVHLEPGACHVTERCVVWLTPRIFLRVCLLELWKVAPSSGSIYPKPGLQSLCPPRLYCPTCARDRPNGRLSGNDFMDRIMFEKFDSLFDTDNYLIPELINLKVLHCDFSKQLRHTLDQLDITIFDSIATGTSSLRDSSDSDDESERDSVLSFSNSSSCTELTDSSTESI